MYHKYIYTYIDLGSCEWSARTAEPQTTAPKKEITTLG